jgi:tetratricopeptide (TPR) repeat protein
MSKKASDASKGPVAHRQINMQMVRSFLLIWLDDSIEDENSDDRNTINQLRRIINIVNTFTDGEDCIQFIQNRQNDKVCMVISGSLGQQIVPRIHHMPQVDSIFIFCGNKEVHEPWAKNWPKIKGVFIEIAPICEALKRVVQESGQNNIPTNFMVTSGDASQKNLDELDRSLMYTKALKEILLTIDFKPEHIKAFIAYCREEFANNEHELNNIKKLEGQYHDKTPIWWYINGGFFYTMVNRALRQMDVNITMKMGFFISDLHRHIEQLYSKQFSGQCSRHIFNVYRGQSMLKADFEQLTKNRNGLISFANFLFTSKARDISLAFARSALSNPDMMGILFIMTIDPSRSTTPFATIADVSPDQDREHEVLFSMDTVFRIGSIQPMAENNRLFQVELTLASDNDKDLRVLTDRVREETFSDSTGWYRLGLLLLKMGQSEKAIQVYQILLDQATNENEKARIYHQIGRTKSNQGEYQEAATFYEKAHEIYEKSLPSNHPILAISYNTIGNVYLNIKDYPKALSAYMKVLEIKQESLSGNRTDLATSYGTIGSVYEKMGKYSKARSFYKRAVNIAQQSAPSNQSELQKWLDNLARVKQKW